MHFSAIFIILGVAVITQATQEAPKGIHFVGIGYNLLKANPEGGGLSRGGVDPGLLITRKIFKLTYEKRKKSTDLEYLVPDQVSFAPRSSSNCQEHTKNGVVTGTKSYQDELKVDVEASGGYDAGLWNVAFSLSSGYKSVENQTKGSEKVFYDFKKVCNRGEVRYLMDSARQEMPGFTVTDDFAAAVCGLPEEYDQDKYLYFIEKWGTNVVVQVTLGQKNITRFESTRSTFYEYAMEEIGNSVGVSGGYGGYSASLKVDVNTFKQSIDEGSKFMSDKTILTAGGSDLPEPIRVRLIPMYKAVHYDFFKHLKNSRLSECDSAQSMAQKSENVERILEEYPKLKGAILPEDPDLRIPLTWPKGTYGLPMPKSGCPKGTNFPWHEGTRYQDTEDSGSDNKWSVHHDLAGRAKKDDMEQKFCMKTLSDGILNWPKGKYCILKKGPCPKGFKQGWIKWDDEDVSWRSNKNSRTGSLPDGKYNKDTKIKYCCRRDGFPTNDIILPTDSPFILYKASNQCQYVKGMNFREDFFRWDTEDPFSTDNDSGGSRPYGEVDRNIKLHYCYYYK